MYLFDDTLNGEREAQNGRAKVTQKRSTIVLIISRLMKKKFKSLNFTEVLWVVEMLSKDERVLVGHEGGGQREEQKVEQ